MLYKIILMIIGLFLVVQAMHWLEQPSNQQAIQSSFFITPHKPKPPVNNPLQDIINETNESQ